MPTQSRKLWMLVLGGVVLGAVLAGALWWSQPLDAYLLSRWEDELATISDDEVPMRLEQIAAMGEQSFPTLVAALHSQRPRVAEAAASILERELAQLELRSTHESSVIVARMARQLAERSSRPGPYAGPASIRLATRFLLWPVDRKAISSEQLVNDCESIIRLAKRSPRGLAAEQSSEDVATQDGLIPRTDQFAAVDLPAHVAGGDAAVLAETPPLPPLVTSIFSESPTAATTEPEQFVPRQTPQVLDTRPSSADEAAARRPENPSGIDSRQDLELRRDTSAAEKPEAAQPTLRSLPDAEVIQLLAEDNQSLVRRARDELLRRGFEAKHFQLAKWLIDPDPKVRMQLVQSLPQLQGIASRPWLLWLSRDQDPEVRKAAVAVIATSTDPALQQRVRELGREETDDDVLRFVQQILNSRQRGTVR